MNITVNGKSINIDKSTTIYELSLLLNIEADFFIVNSFPVDKSYIVNNNDNIALIKKGQMPYKEHLEYLLVSRQGVEVYNKLKTSKVVVCGIGGLGSHVAISLARSGVGTIKIIDFDVVEPSNINRQSYFINQIGLYKTQALKNIIENINPYINIICKNIMLNSHNIINEVSGFDVILECFDNAETKVMLMEKCIKELPSSFIIGASGVAGYFDTDIIKIKKLGSNCIVVGDFENEAGFFKGLMAPRVTACAAVQANEAVKYLLKDI